MSDLTDYDLVRYGRQMMIRGFGTEGQKKLKQSKILIAGVGGLGSPLALYLVAAGVGYIRIVDMDQVELSNLNRQVLHWDEDVGKEKVTSARKKLTRVNPFVHIESVHTKITADNVLALAAGSDMLLDAMDNFESRYVLNAAAVKFKIPLIHGAIYGYEGRLVTLFPGETACLECVFPHAPPPKVFPVVGPTAGVIATLQATEAIKHLTGTGKNLTDTMLVYDGETMTFDRIKISRNPRCKSCSDI